MAPSRNRTAFLLERVRRWWMDNIMHPLALGTVLVILTVGLSNVPTQTPSSIKAKPPRLPQVTKPALPLSAQTRARLNHRRLTGADMTSHNLTAAHFFGRRSASKLSVETRDASKQG